MTIPDDAVVVPPGYCYAGQEAQIVPGSERGGGFRDRETVELRLLKKGKLCVRVAVEDLVG